jgi:glycosyltransferase involved in cell wall biosynthesis
MDREPAFKIQPRPVLLHVGQLIPRKGIDLLFHAAAALQNEGHVFSLLLVGSGRDQQALEQLAKNLGLRNVHFRPAEKPEKMPSVYRSGDVLIFPTLEDVWGLVANEAILCGLPVLCSQYAGCARELLPLDSIFDPKDAGEFRDKLRKALASQLPKAAASCLRTTPELAHDLIRALESSMRDSARSLPRAAQEGFTDSR